MKQNRSQLQEIDSPYVYQKKLIPFDEVYYNLS